MIIDKTVKINVSGGNINHLRSMGYNFKCGDVVEIPVDHLSLNSHVRVNCRCDTCGKEKSLTYQCHCNFIKFDGKYYCSNCMKEKRKRVLIEKYGVENVFQLKDSIEKADKTRLEKYGNSKYRNDEKIKETNLEKYGYENVFQNENIKDKIKETNLERYGFEYAMQCKNVKEKSCQTNIKNFGVPYVQQNNKIFHKSKKTSFKINESFNLSYQGSYELDFLNYCNENGIIKYISKPKKTIKYFYKNKKCYYHPDFYIEKLNLYIEIKSDYWWKIHLERNLIKEKAVVEQKYNYIVIMNKDYSKFEKIISIF